MQKSESFNTKNVTEYEKASFRSKYLSKMTGLVHCIHLGQVTWLLQCQRNMLRTTYSKEHTHYANKIVLRGNKRVPNKRKLKTTIPIFLSRFHHSSHSAIFTRHSSKQMRTVRTRVKRKTQVIPRAVSL